MHLHFTIYEYDPAKPWIITDVTRRTVDLTSVEAFAEWAREEWPAPRYTVELDPGQETRLMR